MDLEAIRERNARAYEEVFALCRGDREWTLSIPEREDDSDRVLVAALRDELELLSEVRRLRDSLRWIAEHTSDSSASNAANAALRDSRIDSSRRHASVGR